MSIEGGPSGPPCEGRANLASQAVTAGVLIAISRNAKTALNGAPSQLIVFDKLTITESGRPGVTPVRRESTQ
jgi:hypothetical protein